MNLARSSLKLSVANVGSALVTFGGVTLFAHLLEPGQLGTFFLFEALVGVFMIPADFGLRGAIEKRLSEGHRPGHILTTAVLLKLAPLTIIIAAILLAGSLINQYAGAGVAVWVVLGILSKELYQLSIQTLRGELRVGETAVLQLVQKLIWVGAGYALIKGGHGVYGAILGMIAGYTVAFLWGLYRCSTRLRHPSRADAESLLAYSKYNFISAISGYFYSWMDILVIGFFLTSAHVGAYEVAWRVTALVLLGSKAIANTVFPKMSSWDANDAVDRIERLIPQAVTPSLVVVIPAFFGVLLLSEEILTFVFEPEYAMASVALIVLMGEKIFQAIHDITGRSLMAIDRPEYTARAAIVTIAINLVLNVVLISQFGLIGAAFATLVSFVVNAVLCIVYLSHFLTVEFPWRELSWMVAASVGMTLSLLLVRIVIPVDSLLQLLLVVFIGALLYGLFLLPSPLRGLALRSLRSMTGNQSRREPTREGE